MQPADVDEVAHMCEVVEQKEQPLIDERTRLSLNPTRLEGKPFGLIFTYKASHKLNSVCGIAEFMTIDFDLICLVDVSKKICTARRKQRSHTRRTCDQHVWA
ncbi:uncharacterized protein LOC110118242 [Ceratitis capitata]|uniref:uncharacterized protein LOC110118242 n=1 Tax=Ceratitis capitata TaxID=7213 RepID=UPI000A10A6D6|nr:uncharacterized protein LOC110118242 [Ceratitis capitata]